LKEAHPEDGDVAAVHRDFGERREAAYARAAGSVRSDRFRTALFDLAEWVEIGPWAPADNAERQALAARPVAEHARAELRRLRKWVRKKGADLRTISVKERHRLRIRAKRLRYASEFFAGTFPGAKAAKRREKSLAALKDLQYALGGLNDLEMRQELADNAEHEAAAHRLGAPEADAKKLLAAAEEAYERFAQTKPFWKG
jgi:CHAD domain-containing protein